MNNRRSFEDWEITTFERPKYLSACCDSRGYDVDCTMRVDPDGSGSKLSLKMTTKPRTFVGKLITPLEWLMSGMMRKIALKDLAGTKAYIEQHSSR